VAVGEPVRWQVEELPQITVTVTEHQCQRVRCPDCGAQTRAELPGSVAQSVFGPRLRAAVATLSVRNRVFPVVMLLSSAKSCSARGSARERWTRSSTVQRER
jgi:hypothetical protein